MRFHGSIKPILEAELLEELNSNEETQAIR